MIHGSKFKNHQHHHRNHHPSQRHQVKGYHDQQRREDTSARRNARRQTQDSFSYLSWFFISVNIQCQYVLQIFGSLLDFVHVDILHVFFFLATFFGKKCHPVTMPLEMLKAIATTDTPSLAFMRWRGSSKGKGNTIWAIPYPTIPCKFLQQTLPLLKTQKGCWHGWSLLLCRHPTPKANNINRRRKVHKVLQTRACHPNWKHCSLTSNLRFKRFVPILTLCKLPSFEVLRVTGFHVWKIHGPFIVRRKIGIFIQGVHDRI